MDVISGAYDHVVQLRAKKVALQAFVLQGRLPDYAVGISKAKAASYKGAQDLKGMRIGVSSPGSGSDMFLKLWLAKEGVKGTRTRQSKHATAARHITRHSVALDLAREADAMDKAIAELATAKVTDAQWSEFVKIMFPAVDDASKRAITRAENNRERLTQLYKADERVAPWHGTALGVMQAANTFDIWERGTRGDTDPNVRQFDDMLSGTLAKAEVDAAKALALVLA